MSHRTITSKRGLKIEVFEKSFKVEGMCHVVYPWPTAQNALDDYMIINLVDAIYDDIFERATCAAQEHVLLEITSKAREIITRPRTRKA